VTTLPAPHTASEVDHTARTGHRDGVATLPALDTGPES
jgi:hypothetical protein